MKHLLLFYFLILAFVLSTVTCDTPNLTFENIEEVFRSRELVLLNFHVDWCPYSRNLVPIFDNAANNINDQFLDRVAFLKVDGEEEPELLERFQVSKFPTIKVIRHGQVGKEYRGQRSVDGILKFVFDELVDSVKVVQDPKEFLNLDMTKRHIIGLFEENSLVHFENLKKVADTQKGNCVFKAGFGKTVQELNSRGQNVINFIPAKAISSQSEEIFTGNPKNFEELNKWVKEKCEPLLLEMTFENAEEIVERRIPLLILFHEREDFESIKKFYDIAQNELFEDKGKLLFTTVDFDIFAHGLRHTGKYTKNLPLFAIDSMKHLYFFPDDEDPFEEGMLKGFLEKFHSEKLHYEFHGGPTSKIQKKLKITKTGEIETREDNENKQSQEEAVSAPLESAFQKLAPSKMRYNFLQKDEL
ncbi:endoplasmic reticulum resident protein 44-like [Artemia franciscana]|uniref:endoplasmic reticulum resident protein 44-like n=1 Tax=Artemia franciscana TaxID=6661 RepID=UPI0032DBF35A